MASATPRSAPVDAGTQLIVGASRGIGLALVTHQLEHAPETQLIAAARGATQAEALRSLQQLHPNRLRCVDVDVTDPASVESMADQLADHSLQLVINTAGVLHDASRGIQPEKRLEDLNLDALEHVMRVNAWGSALLLQALMRKMNTDQPSVWAALSARVGSISDNRIGGWYGYRASKAALNQLLKTASIEAKRRYPHLIIAGLHPGTTDTALSKPFQARVPTEKLFDAPLVAEHLLAVLRGLSPEDSGGFFAWDGQPIPY